MQRFAWMVIHTGRPRKVWISLYPDVCMVLSNFLNQTPNITLSLDLSIRFMTFKCFELNNEQIKESSSKDFNGNCCKIIHAMDSLISQTIKNIRKIPSIPPYHSWLTQIPSCNETCTVFLRQNRLSYQSPPLSNITDKVMALEHFFIYLNFSLTHVAAYENFCPD